MRLEITFKTHDCSIPINYQYQLCSFVYKRLMREDRGFADFLHDKGFNGFKMFTFSQLFFDKSAARNDSLMIWDAKGRWYISSCNDNFLMNFFSSLIQNPQIEIEGVQFPIEQVNVLPEKQITDDTRFIMLSPLVVSVPIDRNGKLYHEFLFPDDERFEEALNNNLVKKHETLFGKKTSSRIKIEPDWQYINRKKRITKLIKIKNIFVKGSIFPFQVKGDPELIKLGYDVGFGEKNSLGFGMVEIAKQEVEV
ncbi:MAG: CRISPR-associated endoribonuclease Cas6 [Pseudothermotoga sp.]